MTNDNGTFCVLPWLHLYVGPDGNVLPCCQADQNLPLGNIEEQPVTEIIASQRVEQLKQNMLAGIKSPECQRCYFLEEAGQLSERKIQNSTWQVDNLADSKILYLDIRLNNICNLKCRMCSGYYSSAIQQEEREIWGIAPASTLKKSQRDLSINQILSLLPKVQKIYFAGGEPLMTLEHYTVLDRLIELGRTDVELVYNTNFTVLNFKNRSVLDVWREFSNVNIHASLDAAGGVAEYVRHGTVWSVVESNLLKLKTQCPNVKFNVASAVGLLNISSLIDLQKHWHTSQLVNISQFDINPIVSPPHLTLRVLPANHKTRIADKIKNHQDWCYANNAKRLALQWANVLTFMLSCDDTHELKEFKRLTLIMDQHRGEKLTDVLPEYSDLINEEY